MPPTTEELAAQQRVHDEVDPAAESRVVVARAQDALLREAGLLRDAPAKRGSRSSARSWRRAMPGSCSAHWATSLSARVHTPVATRIGRNPVADLRDPVVGPCPADADRADRLRRRRRSRSSTSCRSRQPSRQMARCSTRRRPRCTGCGMMSRNSAIARSLQAATIASTSPPRPRVGGVTTPSVSGGSGGETSIVIRYAARLRPAQRWELKENPWRSSRTCADKST